MAAAGSRRGGATILLRARGAVRCRRSSGADLLAAPGTAVRAACAGRVVHAGPVAGLGGVVSIRCGGRRVSYLPLSRAVVREDAWVGAGAPIGTVAPGHGGLHLGVRSEGDRFGYEDPIPLLAQRGRPPAPLPPTATRRRIAPPRVRCRAAAACRAARRAAACRATARRAAASRVAACRAAASRVAARRAAARRSATRRAAHAVPAGGTRDRTSKPAPWPVWAGLALLMTGAAGSGTIAVRRRRLGKRLPRTVHATS